MTQNLDLTRLTGEPEFTATIAGREFHFSELPIAALATLQTWIRANTPHPFDAIKDHVAGLCESDRLAVLRDARIEAKSWPPRIGTASGAAALLGTEPGQLEALAAGLSVHHPDVTRAEVERIFRWLRQDAGRQSKAARKAGKDYDGEGTVKRIFTTLFGLGDGDDDAPKA